MVVASVVFNGTQYLIAGMARDKPAYDRERATLRGVINSFHAITPAERQRGPASCAEAGHRQAGHDDGGSGPNLPAERSRPKASCACSTTSIRRANPSPASASKLFSKHLLSLRSPVGGAPPAAQRPAAARTAAALRRLAAARPDRARAVERRRRRTLHAPVAAAAKRHCAADGGRHAAAVLLGGQRDRLADRALPAAGRRCAAGLRRVRRAGAVLYRAQRTRAVRRGNRLGGGAHPARLHRTAGARPRTQRGDRPVRRRRR